MDGAAPDTRLNAQRKAYTAARSDARSTAELAEKAREDAAERASFDPFFTFFKGGVAVFEGGQRVGAIGVSGLPGPDDDALARVRDRGVRSVDRRAVSSGTRIDHAWSALITATPAAMAAIPTTCSRVSRSWNRTTAMMAAIAPNWDASTAATAMPSRAPSTKSANPTTSATPAPRTNGSARARERQAAGDRQRNGDGQHAYDTGRQNGPRNRQLRADAACRVEARSERHRGRSTEERGSSVARSPRPSRMNRDSPRPGRFRLR